MNLDEKLSAFPLSSVPANEFLTPDDSEHPEFIHLEEGLIKALVPSKALKRDIVTGIVGDHGWCGFDIVYSGIARMKYVSLTDCRFRRVPPDAVMSMASPELTRSFLRSACTQYSSMTARQASLQMDLRHRILVILQHLRLTTKAPEIALSRADLADLLGVGRSRLSVVLKDLAEEGAVELQYQTIIPAPTNVLLRLYRGTPEI